MQTTQSGIENNDVKTTLLVYVFFSDKIYAEWTFHLSKSESTNKNRGSKFKNTFHTLIQRDSTYCSLITNKTLQINVRPTLFIAVSQCNNKIT